MCDARVNRERKKQIHSEAQSPQANELGLDPHSLSRRTDSLLPLVPHLLCTPRTDPVLVFSRDAIVLAHSSRILKAATSAGGNKKAAPRVKSQNTKGKRKPQTPWACVDCSKTYSSNSSLMRSLSASHMRITHVVCERVPKMRVLTSSLLPLSPDTGTRSTLQKRTRNAGKSPLWPLTKKPIKNARTTRGTTMTRAMRGTLMTTMTLMMTAVTNCELAKSGTERLMDSARWLPVQRADGM